MSALVFASPLAARSRGMEDRLGAPASGYEADIIALDGDSRHDPTALRSVLFVIGGRVVYKWAGAKAR